ncbi:MAG: RNA chaperone Hfq [Alphaproteobacteria bacterium]
MTVEKTTEKKQNAQDVFLNFVRKNKTPITMFLMNGIKLQGIITGFDTFIVILKKDGFIQVVYKHAISTIMPNEPVKLYEVDEASL